MSRNERDNTLLLAQKSLCNNLKMCAWFFRFSKSIYCDIKFSSICLRLRLHFICHICLMVEREGVVYTSYNRYLKWSDLTTYWVFAVFHVSERKTRHKRKHVCSVKHLIVLSFHLSLWIVRWSKYFVCFSANSLPKCGCLYWWKKSWSMK